MTDERDLTPAQRARAAGYMAWAGDYSGNTFLSRDSQRLMTAEQVVEELDSADRDREPEAA